MPGTTGKLACWEATINANTFEREDVLEVLKLIAKKWEYQLERGSKTGFLHYQAGFSLVKKARKDEVLELVEKVVGEKVSGWSMRPMSNNGSKTWDYSSKLATRVEGPWKDTDKEPSYIPRHVRGMELRPWQKEVKAMCEEYNDRVINLLYCPKGGIGKSMIIDYLDCHGIAESVPPLNDAKDIMQLVCCVVENCGGSAKAPKAFTFDLPRAMKKDKLWGLYSAIEQIKDGRAYDLRYTYKKHRFDRPQIWVFTNTEPTINMLSADRWRIWEVCDNKLELRPRAAGAVLVDEDGTPFRE